jgi:hypothetical protein
MPCSALQNILFLHENKIVCGKKLRYLMSMFKLQLLASNGMQMTVTGIIIGPCEHGNESSGSVKSREFGYMSVISFFAKDC